MTASTKNFLLQNLAAPFLVALVVGIATGGMTAYGVFQVFGYRLDRAEKDIADNKAQATARLDGLEQKVDSLRDAVGSIRADTSWIRGKLESVNTRIGNATP